MAHTIRGDGLYEAHRALEALIEDPQRLDRARERFSKSPLYKSDLSLDSTRSQSTEPLSEEQRQREERKWQLILEHRASFPSSQFDAQRREEEKRILKADEIDHGWFLVDKMRLADAKVRKLARETVKKRWVEQGIWSDRWKDACPWKWKHEEPLELEPGLDTSTERRTALEWEREQSRPYYQFLYEVSKERERMETELPTASISPDINTQAYETVRSIWAKRNIWNRKWRLLPGMSWTHEQPLEQMLAEEMGSQPLSQSPSPSYTSRSYVHEDRASTSSQQQPARSRRYTSYTSEQKQRRMRSPKNKLTQPAADKVLELHGPAKVSKARTRKKGR